MPMLQCWKVLVPIKMLDGFKSAISSLEQLARRPELIKSTPPSGGGGGDLPWARLMMVGVDSKPGVCIATRREKYLMMVQFLLL
jgi:hypothetical protein